MSVWLAATNTAKIRFNGISLHGGFTPGVHQRIIGAWADPGFLERGFVFIKARGDRFADFLIFLKYPMKIK